MNDSKIDPNVKYTLLLIAFENGLGSFLHFFHVPFAGHALSINQSAILTRLTFITKKKDSAIIASTNTAILKSLGPIGKKLTPMLAILTQGLLFSLPLHLIGINSFSLMLGIILSSLWAFVQPIIILYLLMGKKFIEVINYILKDLNNYIPNVSEYIFVSILFLIVIKLILAIYYSYFLCQLSEENFKNLQIKLESYKKTSVPRKKKISFYFFATLFLAIIFTVYNESKMVNIIWFLLRPIGISIGIYLFIRLVSISRITKFMFRLKLNKMATALQATENYLNDRK